MLGWQSSDQSAHDKEAASLDARLSTNTSIAIGEVNQTPPDTFTRLVAALERIERRLDAPRKPIPVVRSIGIAAGGTVNQQIALPPAVAWQLDTVLVAQRPGATGTFTLTISGLLNLDFFLQSDASGLQSKSVGIPMQQSTAVSVVESGAGTTGGVVLHLIFTPL